MWHWQCVSPQILLSTANPCMIVCSRQILNKEDIIFHALGLQTVMWRHYIITQSYPKCTRLKGLIQTWKKEETCTAMATRTPPLLLCDWWETTPSTLSKIYIIYCTSSLQNTSAFSQSDKVPLVLIDLWIIYWHILFHGISIFVHVYNAARTKGDKHGKRKCVHSFSFCWGVQRCDRHVNGEIPCNHSSWSGLIFVWCRL